MGYNAYSLVDLRNLKKCHKFAWQSRGTTFKSENERFEAIFTKKHAVDVRAYEVACMFLGLISFKHCCGPAAPYNGSHFRVAKQGYHF